MKLSTFWITLLFLIILTSCAPNKVQNECDIKHLLLQKTDFPQGTRMDEPSSPVDGYPARSAGFTADFQYDLMYQLVARYSSSKRAEQEFAEKSGYFEEDSSGYPWKTPIEITYESPFAQNYHVACGNLSQGYQCRMIGQYSQYYVFFFAYISDNGITLQNFQDLLVKLDDRMMQCSDAK